MISVVIGILGGIAAAKFVTYLLERNDLAQSRYQIAVGSQTSASVAGRALDTLVERQLVDVEKDGDNPDNRLYRVHRGATAAV
jgi:hypothetical protein